jgi:hypothetical protein
VGPAARFARRTCCQKRYDSSVWVADSGEPAITPLPTVLGAPGVVALVAPLMWVAAAESSPGRDLNLSW